jgi:plasmid stabilization system protein ParE
VPKEYRVEITRSAERDAVGIYEQIERKSSQRAAKWFAEIERQMHTLSRFPTRCPVIPETDEIGAEYRHLIWGNYRTIFRIEGSIVYVVRVIHGARLLDPSTLETTHLPDSDD